MFEDLLIDGKRLFWETVFEMQREFEAMQPRTMPRVASSASSPCLIGSVAASDNYDDDDVSDTQTDPSPALTDINDRYHIHFNSNVLMTHTTRVPLSEE